MSTRNESGQSDGSEEHNHSVDSGLLPQPPISKIYGSEEAREQAVASLQALLRDKLMSKPSSEFEYIVVEGRVATLSTAKGGDKINPSKAREELKELLESKKDMYVHVHVNLPRSNLGNRGIIEILEGLIGHSKARLSSLMISGNNLTDEFTKWLSREVGENSNDDIFTAVKEIDLSYNYLTSGGVEMLTRALPDLRKLDVRMNMIENAGMFRGNRIIEIFPQRMDRKGTNDASALLQSFRQITTSGDDAPEKVSQELRKLQGSRSKLYGNADDANRLGEDLMAAFKEANENKVNSADPHTAPPFGSSFESAGTVGGPMNTPIGRPRFSPNDVAALAQSQLNRSGQTRLADLKYTSSSSSGGGPSLTSAARSGDPFTGLKMHGGSSLTPVPTKSSRAVVEVQSLIARLEANERRGKVDGQQQQQKKDNAVLMRALVEQLSALQESVNRNQAKAQQQQQHATGLARQQQQQQQQAVRGDGGEEHSEPTVADLLGTLRRFLDEHKAAEATQPQNLPTGQQKQQQTMETYGNDGGGVKEQRMTVAEMEQNLFNSLRKSDQNSQQTFSGGSNSIANRIINVPLRVVPRSEVTKYDKKAVIPEESPGRPSELVCGLDLQSTSRGYLVLYISPFPGQQHLYEGDTILAINGVGLVPKTNSDAKHIRTAFGRNLFDGVLCTVLRTAEGREQMKSYRSISVNRRLYIEGLLQATGVTWKELANSGLTSDPDIAVGDIAARKGCRGGLLRVSVEDAAPMVSLNGDRESVEQVTEQVTELITVLAKRVRDERTNKEAAAQAVAELKAAVLARANAGNPPPPPVAAAKQDSPASVGEGSPVSSKEVKTDEDVRSGGETSSEKDGTRGKEAESRELEADPGEDSEGVEFTSAKESEVESI